MLTSANCSSSLALAKLTSEFADYLLSKLTFRLTVPTTGKYELCNRKFYNQSYTLMLHKRKSIQFFCTLKSKYNNKLTALSVQWKCQSAAIVHDDFCLLARLSFKLSLSLSASVVVRDVW